MSDLWYDSSYAMNGDSTQVWLFRDKKEHVCGFWYNPYKKVWQVYFPRTGLRAEAPDRNTLLTFLELNWEAYWKND